MGISENIRRLRKSLNMTQKDLAESTGLSIGTIQGYEQGRYEPKLDALRLLMESLGCSYADINAAFSCQLVDDRERLEISECCPGDLPPVIHSCYDVHVFSFLLRCRNALSLIHALPGVSVFCFDDLFHRYAYAFCNLSRSLRSNPLLVQNH